MKKYDINSLRVVTIITDNNTRYLICKYDKLTDTYIEVLTNEKVKVNDKSVIEPLSNYYSILALQKYGTKTYEPLLLDKKAIAQKYNEINDIVEVEEKEEHKSNIETKSNNKYLDKATLNFFPNTGIWYSNCFKRPNELEMGNLPCHLRDDFWLSRMLKKDQKLFYISNFKILNYIKTSDFFKQKKHEYELEIVKWQIQWIVGHGENWICDDEYGGDFVYMTPVVDLGIRKGVVDTLSKIGINKDAIEEGLEKYSDLWRDYCMESAFRNEYEPILFLSSSKIEPCEEEHKEKWLKMRKYEYYQRHKKSVDLYGVVSPDMIMNAEELAELQEYLTKKHEERIQYIDQIKNRERGTSRTLKKWFI